MVTLIWMRTIEIVRHFICLRVMIIIKFEIYFPSHLRNMFRVTIEYKYNRKSKFLSVYSRSKKLSHTGWVSNNCILTTITYTCHKFGERKSLIFGPV